MAKSSRDQMKDPPYGKAKKAVKKAAPVKPKKDKKK